jgi:hypothetical protein
MADDLKSQISEAMKKIVLTGVGTIFLTEETVRSYLGELKLPKEMWSGFIENAAKTKQEFLSNFAKESAQVLSRIDIAAEAKKFLEGHRIKISVEVDFDKKHVKATHSRESRGSASDVDEDQGAGE